MKFFNLKQLSPLLVLMLLSCSAPKDNTELVQEAKSFIGNGDTASASIVLKNVIKNDPTFGEARYLLGTLYYTENNFRSAIKELTKALQSGFQHPDVFITLAKSQIALNQFEAVLSTLDEQNFTAPENKVHANLLMTQAFLGVNKPDLAKKQIEQAVQINSSSLHTLLAQALYSAHQGNLKQAIEILDQLLAKDKFMPEALLLKGSILNNQQKYLASAKAYEQYLQVSPNSFGIKTLIAHNYIRASKYSEAKVYVDKLLAQNIENPTVFVLAAQLEYINKNYQESKNYSDKALSMVQNGLAKMISGLSDFYLENYEQSYEKLKVVASKIPNNHQVHKILAILQLKLGYIDELSSNVDKLSGLSADDAELFASFGAELAQQGKTDDASAMFERAVSLAPTNAKIKAKQGIYKTYVADNSAVTDLQQALDIDPELEEANIALSLNYLKQGKLEKAQEIANSWLKKSPDNITALLLNGSVAQKRADFTSANSYFEKVLKIEPNNSTAQFNIAVILSEEKKYQASNKILLALVKQNSEYPYAYRLLITNHVKLKQESEFEVILQSINADNPDAAWPRIILARRFIVQNKTSQAIDLLNTLNQYEKMPQAYFITLSSAYIKENKKAQAESVFQKWQKAQPDQLNAFLVHIDFLDTNKKYKDALTLVQTTLSKKQYKNHYRLLSLEAYYLLANNQPETAAKKITILAKINPVHPFLLRLQGQLSLANKNYNKAVTFLKKSFEAKNNIFTGMYLATAYKESGQEAKAIEFLKAELAKQPNNRPYSNFLAELYVTSKPSKAMKHYKKELEKNKNNVVALNNIAWTLYLTEKYDQAYTYAIRAKELQPEHPQILDTLSLILIKRDQLSEAITLLTKANTLAPKDREIASHLAEALDSDGQTKKAAQVRSSLSNE